MSLEYERRENLRFRSKLLPMYETYFPALYHKCSRIRNIHLICQNVQHQYNKDILKRIVQMFSTSHRLTLFRNPNTLRQHQCAIG
jgi:hypothetical protein